MRGNSGALGGLGIFTKCAVKLHDWPGPPKFSVEPSMPPLNMMMPWLPKEAPKYCACDIVSFSDWEKAIDFMYEACGSEITYIVWKFGGVEHAAGLVHKFKGFEFLAPMIPQLAEEFKHPVIVMQLAQSQEEFDYQQKVLADIVAETGGVRIVPSLMERLGEFKMGELSIQELISRFMAAELMLADDTHLIFLYSGFCINAGYGGTMEPIMKYQMRTGSELKAKYIQKGTIVADGTDGVYLNIFDNGAYTYTEVEFEYDQANEESVQGAREFMEEEKWRGRDEKYGFEHSDICAVIGGIRPYEERVKDIAERSCGFHVWQERIKRALDPHDVCDRSHYGVGVLGKELKID
jgi:hypothetical protein